MAEFMNEHKNLAKNMIPNCAQGKATVNKLWDDLAKRLNAVGPPVKNVKMWMKAYADQKYQAKKKLSFNKYSKKQTGGGPYEEKLLTPSEELLIEAAGLEASVEGNKSVPTFGSKEIKKTEHLLELSSDSSLDGDGPICSKIPLQNLKTPKKKRGTDEKLLLLERNIKTVTDFQANMDAKLNRLLTIQERLLQIKEEEHKNLMTIAAIDIKIKTIELERLQNFL